MLYDNEVGLLEPPLSLLIDQLENRYPVLGVAVTVIGVLEEVIVCVPAGETDPPVPATILIVYCAVVVNIACNIFDAPLFNNDIIEDNDKDVAVDDNGVPFKLHPVKV
jgi:hypothetical protein